jgi:hypothetical protein
MLKERWEDIDNYFIKYKIEVCTVCYFSNIYLFYVIRMLNELYGLSFSWLYEGYCLLGRNTG